MKRDRAQELLKRIEQWNKLERRHSGLDEIGWVAFMYSVPRSKAQRMILAAHKAMAVTPKPRPSRANRSEETT